MKLIAALVAILSLGAAATQPATKPASRPSAPHSDLKRVLRDIPQTVKPARGSEWTQANEAMLTQWLENELVGDEMLGKFYIRSVTVSKEGDGAFLFLDQPEIVVSNVTFVCTNWTMSMHDPDEIKKLAKLKLYRNTKMRAAISGVDVHVAPKSDSKKQQIFLELELDHGAFP